jgi:hypothetical protein
MAESFALVSRLLPETRGGDGDRLRSGSESRSAIAPSWLTRPADRAASRNNEI